MTAASGEVAFRTSGTTGEAVTWLRTDDQLAAEADLLVRLCAAQEADAVVSYAPTAHLYGYLMGRSVPALLGVPCRPVGLTEPAERAFAGLRRPLVAALPASLTHLRHSRPALRDIEELILVHGTAAPTGELSDLLASLGVPARYVELFGSTETGLVATRDRVTADWTLAEDVTIDAGPTGHAGPVPLVVRSPRLARRPGTARPAEYPTGDLVTLTGPRRFRWEGRQSGLVKVNGRRVQTTEVLADLAAAAPGVRLSVRHEPDPLRGEWFSVLVHTGDPGVLDAVRERCRALPAARQPRAVEPALSTAGEGTAA